MESVKRAQSVFRRQFTGLPYQRFVNRQAVQPYPGQR